MQMQLFRGIYYKVRTRNRVVTRGDLMLRKDIFYLFKMSKVTKSVVLMGKLE